MSKKKKKAASNAAWNLTILFIIFGTLYFGLLWWARNDKQSEVADQVRDIFKIAPVEEPAPPPPPPPPPPVVPELEPEPVIAEEPPPPAPTEMEWKTFCRLRSMWPSSLDIAVESKVILTYRNNIYGEVPFHAGQALNVSDFSDDGFVTGQVSGKKMEVHLTATNFASWFENTHGELHYMSYPEKTPIQKPDDYEQELITKLRIWSMKHYHTPLIEIQENNLVLRLHPEIGNAASSDYAPEAYSVARAYLRIQAELGGNDTYASCEIRDPNTGALLGSSGLFVPRF